jgi:hypothetical protein
VIAQEESFDGVVETSGWNTPFVAGAYADVIKVWRSQSTNLAEGIGAEMEWEPVESETMNRIAYNVDESELFIEFKAGNIYVYFDVPSQLFENFKSASSKGQFFHGNIKNKYRYSKE